MRTKSVVKGAWVIPISVIFLVLIGSFGNSTADVVSLSNTTIHPLNNTLNISPSHLTVQVPPNQQGTETFDIIAELPGNTGLNVTVARQGPVSGWISFDGDDSSYENLTAGETRQMNFTVTVPSETGSGFYYANITANSSDAQLVKMNLTINVTETLGRMNIYVNDSLGSPIPSASVFVWDSDTQLVDTGFTNASGNYVSDWFLPGNYTIEASMSGYGTENKNVTIIGDLNMTDAFLTLEPTGAPVLDVSPSSISESADTGDTVSRILFISNTGDLPLINVSLHSNVGWISFSSTFISSIAPGFGQSIYAYLGPLSSKGVYMGTITIDSLNDGTEIVPVIYDVKEETAGPSGGSTGGISPGIPSTSTSGIIIESYPELVQVMPGEIKTIGIGVKNIGASMATGVSVNISGPVQIDVVPESADILTNVTKIFLVDLSVPPGTEYGEHNLVIYADGDGVSHSRKMTLLLVRPGEITDLSHYLEEIQNKRDLIDSIWTEAVITANKGQDVETVFEALENATQILDELEAHLDEKQEPEVKSMMKQVEELAEFCVIEMSHLKAISEQVAEVPLLYKLLVFIMVVIVLIERKRFRQELRKLDRMYTTFMISREMKSVEKRSSEFKR